MVSSRFAWILAAIVAVGGLASGATAAEPEKSARPLGPAWFPRDTLLFVGIRDANELRARAAETSIGQMIGDPSFVALRDRLLEAVAQATQPFQEATGLSLAELATIPQGQVALGLVPVEEGSPPVALVFLVETGDRGPLVSTLLDRGGETLVRQGAQRQTQTLPEGDVTVYRFDGPRRRELVYVERDGVLLVGTRAEAVGKVLRAWQAGGEETLAKAPHYGAVMQRLGSQTGEEPQITFWIDPIEMLRTAGRDDTNARVTLALFPTLGLDGIEGAGATLALATEQYDSLLRMHVRLEPPRTGAVEAVALDRGDVTPESWVPAELAQYSTLHWDVERTYRVVERLYDSFRGEGAFSDLVRQQVDERIGVDFATELLPELSGRMSLVSTFTPPAGPESQRFLIGIRLRDPKRFQAVYDKLTASLEAFLTRHRYAGVDYVEWSPPQLGPDAADAAGPEAEPAPRPPRGIVAGLSARSPCGAVVGDWLLIGRKELLEQAILTHQGSGARLADALDWKLISGRYERFSQGRPSYIEFERPQEGLRAVYALITGTETQARLERQGEQNEFLRNVGAALRDHPLPPFETFARYVGPSGTVLVDDETGWHFVQFQLRRSPTK